MTKPNRLSTDSEDRGSSEPVVRLRHPLRRVLSIIVGLIALAIIVSLVTNERYQWDVVLKYFFSDPILRGLVTTLWLTVVAMLVGIILGVVVAVMKLSTNPTLRTVATVYIWF